VSSRAAPAARVDAKVVGASAAAVAAACAALALRDAPLAAPVRTPIGLALVYATVLAGSAAIARALPGSPGDAPRTGTAVIVPLGVGLLALGLAHAAVPASAPVRASIAAAALSVLAAVAEEALFRGAAFRLLERRGMVLAAAGSAVLFALVHVPAYGWSAFPVDLGAGVLFSWQRFASGRWSVPAATHAAANLLAVMR